MVVQAMDGSVYRLSFGADASTAAPAAAQPVAPSLGYDEDRKEGVLSIRGFPRNWTGVDVRALLGSSVDSTLVCVDVLPPADGGEEGFARVRLSDVASAQKAMDALSDQRVAGQPLMITLEAAPARPPQPAVSAPAVASVVSAPLEDRNAGSRSHHQPHDPLRPSYMDYDKEGEKPRKYKTERCRHYDRGFCKLGNRCNFAHGDNELDEKPVPHFRDRDREHRDRERERERQYDRSAVASRGQSDNGSSGGSGGRGGRFIIIHIDELDLSRRPRIDPLPHDREVFVDPMPEEEHLSSCLAAFGDVDEVFILPEQHLERPGRRGYVRFRDHAAASRCVSDDFGTWSESERTLSSQRAQRQIGANTGAAYPDSVIARLVGSRGSEIQRLQDECGAQWLHLRGEDLGRTDHRFPSSSRVHFIAEGDERAFSKVRGVLEKRLSEIHDSISDRIREDEAKGRRRPGTGYAQEAHHTPPLLESGASGYPGVDSRGMPGSEQRPPPWGPPDPHAAAAAAAWGYGHQPPAWHYGGYGYPAHAYPPPHGWYPPPPDGSAWAHPPESYPRGYGSEYGQYWGGVPPGSVPPGSVPPGSAPPGAKGAAGQAAAPAPAADAQAASGRSNRHRRRRHHRRRRSPSYSSYSSEASGPPAAKKQRKGS
eukprot:TRINITY_DN18178_c0_g1_i2.p1 TRINITY_DN18178_c0_g1~~TRINITY_DN18178_c0_g1_i2.p1  ORF type:complete len:652 (-),score=131.11 TRINITY_DN18178_c0_g1_i2:87-2042(-)